MPSPVCSRVWALAVTNLQSLPVLRSTGGIAWKRWSESRYGKSFKGVVPCPASTRRKPEYGLSRLDRARDLRAAAAQSRKHRRGPGKFQMREFGFTKRPDSASAPMFLASHAGQHFDGAILAVEGPGTPIWLHFSDVLITSYRQGLPTDSFTIGLLAFSGPPARRPPPVTSVRRP
jgi:hypothetical protein